MFNDFREREEGRERQKNINVRKKHQSFTSSMHRDWGSNLPPRYVPWLGIKPTTYRCTGQRSNQLSHLARAIPVAESSWRPSSSLLHSVPCVYLPLSGLSKLPFHTVLPLMKNLVKRSEKLCCIVSAQQMWAAIIIIIIITEGSVRHIIKITLA